MTKQKGKPLQSGCPPGLRLKLGLVPDRLIAQKAGVSVRTVGLWRKKANIPAYLTERGWTAKEVKRLGTMTDAELAIQINRTPHAVKTKRIKSGIAAFGGQPLDYAELAKLATKEMNRR